ncbi:MAG: ABC transporter permease [Blastocatellia bacterium]
MEKLFAVIKREYLTRVKSKGFFIGTILSPIVMVGFAVMPYFLARSSGPDKYRIAVLDRNGDAALVERMASLLAPAKSGDPKYELTREAVGSEAELESRRQALTQEIEAKRLDGYLILPPDALNQEEVVCYAKNTTSFSHRSRLGDAIDKAISESRIARAGLKPDEVRRLTKSVNLRLVNERGENDRGKAMLGFALLMILYITILVYGVTVMRGVIEEKQSRIIEVLLASVKPFDLMLGKVVGIGLVGLTQYLVWAISGVCISLATASSALGLSGSSLPKISVSLMVFFVVYYLLGYFLYATLYAMVGAIVSNEDDGNQLQMPISMTFAVSLVLATIVMEDPGGTRATVLSLVPYFGPALMFLRIAFDAAPPWQIALSITLMIVTILFSVWVAAKIYRVGMLMYGKRPTLPELARWLRYS